jgi:glycoside/pentoside/hexuronide:cation symporter, GPH family
MRLAGAAPANGTGAVFILVMVFSFFSAAFSITGFIIVSSMMADVVEDVAVTTGSARKACCLPPSA